MCVAWEEALNEGRKVCWAQQQPWSAQWGESSVRCSFLHCARVTWGSVAVFLTFPSLCPPFAQLKEPWYWMWLVLSCLSLCDTKLIFKKSFSPLQLYNLDSLSSCHPKRLRCTGVRGWEEGDGEPNWEHHRCGDLVQMMWGDRKQRLPRMLYLRGARASLNICKCPSGSRRQIPALLFLSEAVASAVVFSWWNRNPPGDFSILITKPVLSAFSAQALFPVSCFCWKLPFQAPLLPRHPQSRTALLFLLRLSSNAASSEKSSPEFTPFFALPAWTSHQVQVSHPVHLVS